MQNIKHEVVIKQSTTNLEKYRVINPLNNPEIRVDDTNI